MEKPLAYFIGEDALEQLIAFISGSEPVAVSDVEALAVPFTVDGFTVDKGAGFFGQVILHPQVVVAHVYVHWNALVNQSANGRNQAGEAFGYSAFVFKPEVKQVTHQKDLCGIVGRFFQPSHDEPFTVDGLGVRREAQMKV